MCTVYTFRCLLMNVTSTLHTPYKWLLMCSPQDEICKHQGQVLKYDFFYQLPFENLEKELIREIDVLASSKIHTIIEKQLDRAFDDTITSITSFSLLSRLLKIRRQQHHFFENPIQGIMWVAVTRVQLWELWASDILQELLNISVQLHLTR